MPQVKAPDFLPGLEVAYCVIGIEVHRGSGRKLGKLDFIVKQINARIQKLEDYEKRLAQSIPLSDEEAREFDKEISYNKTQL